MQYITRINRELCKHDRAEKPEPGISQHGSEHIGAAGGKAQVAQHLREGIAADRKLGHRRGCRGHGQREQQTEDGHEYGRPDDHVHANRTPTHQTGTDQLAGEYADKGTHLHHAIATHQLTRVKMLRQVGMLDRPEQGRVQAHAHHGEYQHPQLMRIPAHRRHQHDEDFQHFDETHQPRLVILVGHLAGGG